MSKHTLMDSVVFIFLGFGMVALTLLVMRNDNKSVRRDIEIMEKVLINSESIGKNSGAIITNQRSILDLYKRFALEAK